MHLVRLYVYTGSYRYMFNSSKLSFLTRPLVLLAFGVVASHIVQRIRHDGCKEVLKHPTCRYIPQAPPPSAYFAPPFDTQRFKNENSSASPSI